MIIVRANRSFLLGCRQTGQNGCRSCCHRYWVSSTSGGRYSSSMTNNLYDGIKNRRAFGGVIFFGGITIGCYSYYGARKESNTGDKEHQHSPGRIIYPPSHLRACCCETTSIGSRHHEKEIYSNSFGGNVLNRTLKLMNPFQYWSRDSNDTGDISAWSLRNNSSSNFLATSASSAISTSQSASNSVSSSTSNENKNSFLLKTLTDIVGPKNVLTLEETSVYTKGERLGQGEALAVVKPGTIGEAVECLRAIVSHDAVCIPQGRNTGLTGGSVPRSTTSNDKRRPTVILNTQRLNTIRDVDDGKRVLCGAGVGIATLSNYCSTKLHRESHSTLGSVFLNPTVSGGVAFNSGGTQLRKGPAYTERALYAKVLEDGQTVQICNELGLKGLHDNEILLPTTDTNNDEKYLLNRLDQILSFDSSHDENQNNEHINNKQPTLTSSHLDPYGKKPASDRYYCQTVCRCNDNKVSRYNADTKGPCYNRCEGKVLLLATIHDTFPKPLKTKTYWISFENLQTALDFRKQVCLHDANHLPVSVEYMDRDAFDVVDHAGRMLVYLTKAIGTGEMMGRLWNVKLWIESFSKYVPLCDTLCDQFMFWTNYIFGPPLPKPIMNVSKSKGHHLLITVANFDNQESGLVEDDNCINEDDNDKGDISLKNGIVNRLYNALKFQKKESARIEPTSSSHVKKKDNDDNTIDIFERRLKAFVDSATAAAAAAAAKNGQQEQQLTRRQRDAEAVPVKVYECQSLDDVQSIQSFRFAAAPAFRTYCVGHGYSGISVDYALPKNGGRLPPLRHHDETKATAASPKEKEDKQSPIILPKKRMRYSHFGCNVVHEDLAYDPTVDVHNEKMSLKHSVEREGGKLPAEHGHGTEYIAPPETQERWKQMDPSNSMNPGVGGLTTAPYYRDDNDQKCH